MNKYLKRNKQLEYRKILNAPTAPAISVVAPAYNEGLTIVDNVRSLLSIQYHKYEVIIVNDGSQDDSLNKLIQSFDLNPVNVSFSTHIKTEPISCMYKSSLQAFEKLVVIDKKNGGKADALNAGINVASKELVACIDVDSILEPDALLKMVKPYLDSNNDVIASGGVIRIANSCTVQGGKITETRIPKNLIARFQVIEYLRAFLLGRLAWSKLNGLLLVSGAFGLFRKEILIKCGGYLTDTVGEDMELVVRMRRYMHERGRKYKVIYIPDPLCWTEAPSNYRDLGNQRNRWTRGTIETLIGHRKLLLNPRYGRMGLISYPYWILFEWMAPFMELLGIIYFIILAILGLINWQITFLILLAIYSFAIMVSMMALLIEEISFRRYAGKKETIKLALVSLIEPILYHPRIVYWGLKGNLDFLRGKKSWGKMQRVGFK